MSNQEPDLIKRPRIEKGWNHARFTVATRLPTAVGRAKSLNRGTLQAIRAAARIKR